MFALERSIPILLSNYILFGLAYGSLTKPYRKHFKFIKIKFKKMMIKRLSLFARVSLPPIQHVHVVVSLVSVKHIHEYAFVFLFIYFAQWSSFDIQTSTINSSMHTHALIKTNELSYFNYHHPLNSCHYSLSINIQMS